MRLRLSLSILPIPCALVFAGCFHRASASSDDPRAQLRQCVEGQVRLAGYRIERRRRDEFRAISEPVSGSLNNPVTGAVDRLSVRYLAVGFTIAGTTWEREPEKTPEGLSAVRRAPPSPRLRALEERLHGTCDQKAG